MGEDLPLDPNQVKPPHEGEAGHIEVTHQTGETELPTLSSEASQDETTDGDTSSQAAPKKEQVGPNYIHNKDKAKGMADAEGLHGHYGYKPDGGKWHRRVNARSIEDAVQRAGDDYEVQEIAARDGKSPEEVKKLLSSDRRAFLDYSRAMIENQKRYGEKLSPNHVVLEAVHELADRYPELISTGRLEGQDMNVSISYSKIVGGALNVDINHSIVQPGNIFDEEWTAPAFNSVSSWRSYKATSHSREDPDFDLVTTAKRRIMREEDAERLKDLLAGANFEPEPEDDYTGIDDHEEDEVPSSSEVRARARAVMGNTDAAREAAAMTPGDFI